MTGGCTVYHEPNLIDETVCSQISREGLLNPKNDHCSSSWEKLVILNPF